LQREGIERFVFCFLSQQLNQLCSCLILNAATGWAPQIY